MSLLLIGSPDADEYEEWRRHLHARLLPGEVLVLANEPHEPALVEIALAANPSAGALAGFPRRRFIQSL